HCSRGRKGITGWSQAVRDNAPAPQKEPLAADQVCPRPRQRSHAQENGAAADFGETSRIRLIAATAWLDENHSSCSLASQTRRCRKRGRDVGLKIKEDGASMVGVG